MNFSPHQNTQFKIVSALNEDMALDCIQNNQHKVILFQSHCGDNQKWYIKNVQKNKYIFINVAVSLALTCRNNPQKQGLQISCQPQKKTQRQQWELVPCNQEQLKNKHAFYFKSNRGKVMDLCEGRPKNYQSIIQYQQKKGNLKERANQIWFIEPVSFIQQKNKKYKIFSSLDYSKVMDASGNPQHLNDLIVYQCNKGDNQNFRIQSYQGKYLLTCQRNNLSVQVEKGSQQNQAQIIASHRKGLKNELWELIPCSQNQFKNKSAFYFRSHCGKYLDISNGQAVDEASLIQWDYNGNKNQIWFIHKI